MIEYLMNLDTEVFLFLHSGQNAFWDIAMKMASGRLIWAGMYLVMIYAMLRTFGWRTTVVMTLMAIVAVGAADQICASVLRPIFERLRPSNLDNPLSAMVRVVDGYRSGAYGFPSCHAANTFALATVMSMLFFRRRFTFFIIFWALLNCYSRIYLGVHYPGDLMAGIIIGILCGMIFFLVGRLWINYWPGCKIPGAHDHVRKVEFNGWWPIYYRPVDLVIIAGVLTMISILICAASIFV